MGLFILIGLVLIARLGYLQLALGSKLEVQARTQQLRTVPLAAPRGQIFDRYGLVLATNRPSFVATLNYTGKPLPDTSVQLLHEILGIDAEMIRRAENEELAYQPFQPVPLKVDISPEEHVALEEHRAELPGISVEVWPMREYPGLPDFPAIGGRLASHVLGYVLRGDDSVSTAGRWGLEQTFNGNPAEAENPAELLLQGKNGKRLVEVDPYGRPVVSLGEEAPIPGNDLHLTLDARLQAVAEKALAERMDYLRSAKEYPCPCPANSGAVVVVDVNSGAIRAMASLPSFDPNDFAKAAYALPGSKQAEEFAAVYAELNSEENIGRPLINHAIQDAQPTGSTFKPITALAALNAKVVDIAEEIFDPGYFEVIPGQVMRDWTAGGHGLVNILEAIGRSCNIFFYHMGQRLGIEPIASMAKQFGLGQKTGLDDLRNEGENPGLVADPVGKAQACANPNSICFNERWNYGDTLNASIGQGFNSFTPLQMAMMTAAIANGGTRYRPYLVEKITGPDGKVIMQREPEVLGKVEVDPEALDIVRRGMLSVTEFNPDWQRVDSRYGTAWYYFQGFREQAVEVLGRDIRVAAKTGTAETGGSLSHGWFIAFAPYDQPELAIAVYIEKGGGGSLSGATITREILEEYFGLNEDRSAEQTDLPVSLRDARLGD